MSSVEQRIAEERQGENIVATGNARGHIIEFKGQIEDLTKQLGEMRKEVTRLPNELLWWSLSEMKPLHNCLPWRRPIVNAMRPRPSTMMLWLVSLSSSKSSTNILRS